jgi:hypothetical protein
MLLHEYIRLAKSVDYASIEQSQQAIGVALDRIKRETGAIIVDLWTRVPGYADIDILEPYLRRSEPGILAPLKISLTDQAVGLLVWVAETGRPVWLNDIDRNASSWINQLTNEPIEGRHKYVYVRTSEYFAIPIRYRSIFAILAIEMLEPNRLQPHHIDIMQTYADPTGILIWKASVCSENRKQTDEAIESFRYTSTTLVSNLSPYRKGFVARPFEYSFHIVGKAIEQAFKKHRVQATSYQIRPGSPYIFDEMLRQINSAHFGIADITSLNENVLIELGAMLATAKPILIIMNKDARPSPLPFNIAGAECYTYKVVDGRIEVSFSNYRGTLQDWVEKFIAEKLLASRVFQEARKWSG